MRMARGFVLALGLVFGLILGAPVALSGISSPVATPALVADAAAQACSTIRACLALENEGSNDGNDRTNGGSGANEIAFNDGAGAERAARRSLDTISTALELPNALNEKRR